MKHLIAVFLIISTFVGFGIWILKDVTKSSANISKSLNSIEVLVNNEDWSNAYDETLEAKKVWDKQKIKWILLMDRHDLDNIDVSLFRIIEFIKLKEKALITGEITEAKFFIKHLPETQSINFKNIF